MADQWQYWDANKQYPKFGAGMFTDMLIWQKKMEPYYSDYQNYQVSVQQETAANAPALYDQSESKTANAILEEPDPTKQSAPSVRRRNRRGKKDLIIKQNAQVNKSMGTPGGGSGLGIPG